MKRLPLYTLLGLLLLVVANTGCGQFRPTLPTTAIQRSAAINQTFDSTLKAIERLHDIGAIPDRDRLNLQPDIDLAQKWRVAVQKAAESGSKDEPFSDFRSALETFNEYFDKMTLAQLQGEKMEAALNTAKSRKPRAPPQSDEPTPIPPTDPETP